jgi:hypothetical protein
MRKWIPIALIVLAVLWYVLTNVGASMALSDFAARPLVALSREDKRVPVEQPGSAGDPGQARLVLGEGVSFGYRFTFQMPDGSQVTCRHRFHSLTCSDGWQPERAP